MPVEIRELVIRAITTPGSQSSEPSPHARISEDERETIIQECVRQVLKILQRKKER
jgi:hypothetical protein